MLDLGGADAEGQRAQRAVGRRVGIAADDRLAGQREAELRPDDMDDTLARIERRDVGHAEVGDIGFEGLDLPARLRLGDTVPAIGCRDVVVDHGERCFGPAHPAAGGAQTGKGLRTMHLVEQVAIDVEHAGAVVEVLHDVRVPYLVEQRAGHVESPQGRRLSTIWLRWTTAAWLW